MQSALPEHLRKPRHYSAQLPKDHQPPFPAWTARFSPLMGQVVMAYIGIQAADKVPFAALHDILHRFSLADGPLHWDVANYRDALNYHNLIAIAYWPSPQQFQRWKYSSLFAEWWDSAEREQEQFGYFLEVVSPATDRFETIFSDQTSPEGVAHLADSMSDEIIEHGYWGSARDRMPAAQYCLLGAASTDTSAVNISAKRIKLAGRDNLCLIRSGQDWSSTRDEERKKYCAEVEPVLREGMLFLRDSGQDIGCLSCRYMAVIDANSGAPTEKSFGLAHFIDMQSLELWAKSHPTHVAIFGEFMRYVQALNFNIALRLYHEIAVIPAESQYFEYINCHSKSGLLAQYYGELR